MRGQAPGPLRRAALEALGDYGDPRARDALHHGELAVTAGVATWESSGGRVHGHRVTLSLDAGRLGALRAAPAAVDALHRAVAVAVASAPGEALHDLTLVWGRDVARVAPAGYRDAPPAGPLTVRQALVDYLEGMGEGALAATVAGAEVGAGPDELRVVAGPGGLAELRGTPVARAALEGAARDLMGAPGLRLVLEE